MLQQLWVTWWVLEEREVVHSDQNLNVCKEELSVNNAMQHVWCHSLINSSSTILIKIVFNVNMTASVIIAVLTPFQKQRQVSLQLLEKESGEQRDDVQQLAPPSASDRGLLEQPFKRRQCSKKPCNTHATFLYLLLHHLRASNHRL